MKMIFVSNPLEHLQKRLKAYYTLYKKGEMSEKEYLINVKPIDKAIYHWEMHLFNRYVSIETSFSMQNTQNLIKVLYPEYSLSLDGKVPRMGKQNQDCFY